MSGRGRARRRTAPWDSNNPANWTTEKLSTELHKLNISAPASMGKHVLKKLYLDNSTRRREQAPSRISTRNNPVTMITDRANSGNVNSGNTAVTVEEHYDNETMRPNQRDQRTSEPYTQGNPTETNYATTGTSNSDTDRPNVYVPTRSDTDANANSSGNNMAAPFRPNSSLEEVLPLMSTIHQTVLGLQQVVQSLTKHSDTQPQTVNTAVNDFRTVNTAADNVTQHAFPSNTDHAVATTQDREMKSKKGCYRLSPNEEAQIIKEETERRRKQRLLQVREQAKQNAASIRQAVKQEKDRQIHKLASQLQNQLEKEKEEKVRKLEAQYENCLKSIGQGHTEAGEQVDRGEELQLMQLEDNRRADIRGKEAIRRMNHEKIYKEYEENKIINARKSALNVEKERATKIASLPAPALDPILNIETTKRKPVKMTDSDNFCTTHYHMAEEFAVDKADPDKQEDARIAAEEEEIKTKEKDLEMVRLHNDRLARARVRHNNALEKEMLHHDYDDILADLSCLQRADRERRQRVVANIPKQVFEPPHRRLEDREDKQKDMEEAFEDMYMAETKYMGDLSMALDPHPPPDTPTATESLEVSVLDETPIPEPSLNTIPTVLKDMTNTPRKTGDKKPEKVLKKLMDKIKTQRQEWISKSALDDTAQQPLANGHLEPETELAPSLSQYSLSETGTPYMEPDKIVVQPVIHSRRQPQDHRPQSSGAPQSVILEKTTVSRPLLHPMEMATKVRQKEEKLKEKPEMAEEILHTKGPVHKTVETILQQQREIEEQKRQLEAKLRQLEEKQELLSKSVPLTTTTVTLSYADSTTAKPVTSTVTAGSSASVQMSSAGLVAHLANKSPKSTGFYGISELPAHFMHDTASPSISQSLPEQPAKTLSDSISSDGGYLNALTSISQNLQYFSAPRQSISDTTVNGMPTSLQPPLPVGAYLSSAARQHPTHSLSTSLPPVPQTVSGVILPGSEVDQHIDHLRKVREYQQSMLKRHEHSKKVLADTRAAIEQRRKELSERFPQLELKSPESDHLLDVTAAHKAAVTLKLPPRLHTANVRSDTAGKASSPAKNTTVSALLTRLASHPYYVSKLSQPKEMQKFTDSVFGKELHHALHSSNDSKSPLPGHTVGSDSKSMKDKVRKSLPFDDSLGESPIVTALSRYGDVSTTENETEDESRHGRKSELDDSHLSSSTDRGSPALPGRGNMGKSSNFQTGVSFHAKDPKTEIYEKRQEDIRRQLAEIQRQKEEILQHHLQGQRRLIAQRDELKEKLKKAQRQADHTSDSDITLTDMEKSDTKGLNDTTLSEDTSALDTTDLSSDASPDLKAQLKQLPTVSRPTASALLGSHKPHDLSTIQEVDTPASTRHSHPSSGSDGRPSLSGSDHSSTRRSLDFIQHPAIVEEADSGDKGPSPTNRRIAGDTGYFTGDIADVLARARELDPTILDKLKQQTNDVFSTADGSASAPRGTTVSGSFTSLSGGTLTPSSLSAGPLDVSNTSMISQGATDGGFAFKVVPTDASNTSQHSNKSWADEFSSYQEQFRSLQPERASSEHDSGFKVMKPNEDKSYESDLTQYSLSGDDRTREESTDKSVSFPDVWRAPVDRRYDILHFTVPPNSQNHKQLYDSDRSLKEKSSIEQLAEELSHQTPQTSIEDQPLNTGMSSETSSVDVLDVRRSPLGHLDSDLGHPAGGIDPKTRESMSSSISEGMTSSASSYMDMQIHGRSTHDFGPFLREDLNRKSEPRPLQSQKFRSDEPSFPTPDMTAPTVNSLNQSSALENFNRQLAYTSTPFTQKFPAQIKPATRFSDVSGFTISPETNQQTTTSLPFSQMGISSVTSKAADNLSNQNSRGSSHKSSPASEIQREASNSLSQYTIKPDTVGITVAGPTLSQYTLKTDGSLSADSGQFKTSDQLLSQYSLDSSKKSEDSSQNEASLTQITIDSEDIEFFDKGDNSALQKTSTSKGEKTDSSLGLSQHSLTPEVTGETEDLSLSQHSLDESIAKVRTPGVEITNISLPETTQTGMSISQFSLASDASEEAVVEKKFANLDNLIKESKDLIAKHKELVNRNNDNQSNNARVDLTDYQAKVSDLAAEYGFQKSDFIDGDQSARDSLRFSTTTGSSFNVTEENTPLKLTQDSATIVTSSLPSDVISSSLDQIGQETGISDEPNLTLVSSDMSMNQEGMNQSDVVTPRSEGVNSGSQGSDSTLSFEQHEISFSTEQENSENTARSSQDVYDFSAMKPLYLQGLRSFKWAEELDNKDDEDADSRSLSPPKEPPPPPPDDVSPSDSDEDPDTPRDSGDEIFHAVPVVISPSMSLSMKFNSSQELEFNKPPVSWSAVLDERNSDGTDTVNKAVIRHEAGGKETKPIKSFEISTRSAAEPVLRSRSLDLNSKSSDFSSSDKVSVSDRKRAFEDGSTGVAQTRTLNKSLQPRGRTSSSDLETKKSTSSEQGKFTSPGALSLGEFLKSQKASEPAALKSTGLLGSDRPKSAPPAGKKEEDQSGIVRSVGATGLSKTLSSWKKSRGVKSTAPPPKPVQSKEMPSTAVKVLPKDAIPALAEEEKRRAAEKKKYDRNMRLCSKFDDEEEVEQEVKPRKPEDREKQRQAVAAANRDKVKEFQRKLNENMKKKQALKKQQQDSKK